MINLKKVGLTALAGSLVAFSANAAEFSVSGGVEMTYTTTGGTDANAITGNPFGANSGVTLSGSGDVGFGTVSATRAFSDLGSMATAHQSLDMGDLGTLSFDSSAGGLVGIAANDDLNPTAYEESWTGVSGDGITGVGSTNVIGYKNTFAGVSLSAGYTKGNGATATSESGASGEGTRGSTTDIYLSMSPIDGFTIGAGSATNSNPNSETTGTADTKEWVGQVQYSSGPVSIGYRRADSDSGAAATAGTEMESYSIAFNVNDNFAISYGAQDTTKKALASAGSTVAAVKEEVTGISAAYTVGAASIRFNHSESDNDGKIAGVKDETTEIGVVLSF